MISRARLLVQFGYSRKSVINLFDVHLQVRLVRCQNRPPLQPSSRSLEMASVEHGADAKRSNKAAVLTRTPECRGNSKCASFDKLLADEHRCLLSLCVSWDNAAAAVRGVKLAANNLAVPSRSPSFTRHRLR